MTGTLAGQLSAKVHVGISVGEFGSWMASEQRRIFLLCRRMLQDVDEADSATQDVFLKAYRSICQSPEDAADLEHPGKWLTHCREHVFRLPAVKSLETLATPAPRRRRKGHPRDDC